MEEVLHYFVVDNSHIVEVAAGTAVVAVVDTVDIEEVVADTAADTVVAEVVVVGIVIAGYWITGYSYHAFEKNLNLKNDYSYF